MFEDSLVESQGTLASSQRSTRRALMLVSITFQCSLVAAFLAIPLLHPERLPFHLEAPRVLPILRRTPPPVVKITESHATSTASASLPDPGRTLMTPRLFPTTILLGSDPQVPPIADFGTSMEGPGVPAALGGGTSSHIAVVAAKPVSNRPVRVSAGVSNGLLIQPIRPVYPAIAKAAHMEGTVVIEAVISKSGQIESAHVLTGPAMLQQAAIDAVRAARYSPYKLNGDPTEVLTTITINFRLGS